MLQWFSRKWMKQRLSSERSNEHPNGTSIEKLMPRNAHEREPEWFDRGRARSARPLSNRSKGFRLSLLKRRRGADLGLKLAVVSVFGMGLWVGSLWEHSSSAIVRRMPVSLALIINNVRSGPTVDLPPLDQKPALYAELELDGERLTTGTERPAQIGASIYPDWAIYVEKEAIWIERGHPIAAAVRIFDQDTEDADDKILLTALSFDPIACQVAIGDAQLEGDRQGSFCRITIAELLGENGQANITLTADW